MRLLPGCRVGMSIFISSYFICTWSCRNTSRAIKSGTATATMNCTSIFIGAMNRIPVDMAYGSIIIEMASFPSSSFITNATIAISVIHPSIKANMWPPISPVPSIIASLIAPITRCPQIAYGWRPHPCAWYPIVPIWIVGPVTGCPQIPIIGAVGLYIIGYFWRRHGYLYFYLCHCARPT